jgi:hypothetical protein
MQSKTTNDEPQRVRHEEQRPRQMPPPMQILEESRCVKTSSCLCTNWEWDGIHCYCGMQRKHRVRITVVEWGGARRSEIGEEDYTRETDVFNVRRYTVCLSLQILMKTDLMSKFDDGWGNNSSQANQRKRFVPVRAPHHPQSPKTVGASTTDSGKTSLIYFKKGILSSTLGRWTPTLTVV